LFIAGANSGLRIVRVHLRPVVAAEFRELEADDLLRQSSIGTHQVATDQIHPLAQLAAIANQL
jgi:hypothetical protein